MNRNEKIAKILGIDVCENLDKKFMDKYQKIINKLTNNKSNKLSTKNEYTDLKQDGLVCLYESLDKFDFDKGIKFSTFFYNNLKRKLGAEFEGKYKGLKVTTHARKKEIKLLKESKFEEASRVFAHIFSVSNEALKNKVDTSKDEDALSEEDTYAMLKECLNEKELYIVSSLFGIVNEKKRVNELAKELECSRNSITNIKNKCFEKIKLIKNK